MKKVVFIKSNGLSVGAKNALIEDFKNTNSYPIFLPRECEVQESNITHETTAERRERKINLILEDEKDPYTGIGCLSEDDVNGG